MAQKREAQGRRSDKKTEEIVHDNPFYPEGVRNDMTAPRTVPFTVRIGIVYTNADTKHCVGVLPGRPDPAVRNSFFFPSPEASHCIAPTDSGAARAWPGRPLQAQKYANAGGRPAVALTRRRPFLRLCPLQAAVIVTPEGENHLERATEAEHFV